MDNLIIKTANWNTKTVKDRVPKETVTATVVAATMTAYVPPMAVLVTATTPTTTAKAATMTAYVPPMAVLVNATTPTTTSIATKLTLISMIGLMLTQYQRMAQEAYAEPGTNLNTTRRNKSMGLRSRALV